MSREEMIKQYLASRGIFKYIIVNQAKLSKDYILIQYFKESILYRGTIREDSMLMHINIRQMEVEILANTLDLELKINQEPTKNKKKVSKV